jgi:thiosulfate/3-mercaptopyruvate sulfurtransferase
MTLMMMLLFAYARPEMLVETDWLVEHLNDGNIVVVDMRNRFEAYADGHVPGAVYLANNLIKDMKRGPDFVPSKEDFEKLMSSLGVSSQSRVIAYDERGGIYAARLWWILNYYGHTNVALLNGGWVKWSKERRASTTQPSRVAPAVFNAKPDRRWIATAQDVVAAIGKPETKIVDARTAAEIEGRELRNIRNGGHIPGAIPVYWEDALTSELTFKPADQLEKLFKDRGIVPTDRIIAYCQVGMRASVDLFALHLIGYDNLKNYYGSWEEWGNRDDLPIKKPN